VEPIQSWSWGLSAKTWPAFQGNPAGPTPESVVGLGTRCWTYESEPAGTRGGSAPARHVAWRASVRLFFTPWVTVASSSRTRVRQLCKDVRTTGRAR
jgi:hypothetical protein